ASPRPCRWPSTWRSRATSTPPSPCRCSCCWSRSPSCSPSAPAPGGWADCSAVLDVHLVKRRAPFTLDASFRAALGSTTVLVGESGAGKTTALRLLAGLDRLDGGFITLGGNRYGDAAGLHRPAWQRDIGYVAQDYAL